MGLTVAIGNALAGLKANQGSLEVLSRNISNAGTPGYHKQSLNVIEVGRGDNSYVRVGQVSRAFDQTLQNYYTRQLPDSGYASTRANFLDRLQTYLGKPGSAGALDTSFGSLQSALDALATSPDNYASRADVISKAQDMVSTLNRLTTTIQGLRQEAEGKIATSVAELNDQLKSLQEVNLALSDYGMDHNTRVSMLDQRDRLVSQIAEKVDLRVDYRDDGTVALSTRSGMSLLDVKRSIFEFEAAGGMDASSANVGKLTLLTPSGSRVDLVSNNVLKSGSIASLIELRDKTLQDAQRQLDDIAAALAKTFSTVQTNGTAVAGGFEIDLANPTNGVAPLAPAYQNGDDLVVSYRDGTGASRGIRVVNTAGTTPPPANYVDANGDDVFYVNLQPPRSSADIAGEINAMMATKSPPMTGITFADNAGKLSETGSGGIVINSMTARTTATSNQDGNLALPLFLDANGNGTPYTGAVDGLGQKLGFAGRIKINPAVVADNTMLVKYSGSSASGDSARVDYIVNQFKTMKFASEYRASPELGNFRLNGTLGDIVNQTVDYQGSTISDALSKADAQSLSLEALTSRMTETYGVDVNEEVARLMELQNAYAANARVVSVVQELLDTLMQTVGR